MELLTKSHKDSSIPPREQTLFDYLLECFRFVELSGIDP